MARTKSRAIQVHPEIEAPPKQPTPSPLSPSTPTDCTDRRDDEPNPEYNLVLKGMSSSAASPRSRLAFQISHGKDLRVTIASNPLSCPNCQVDYNASDLQQYRDHVESCVRPGLAESDDESATSQLSTPPASVGGGELSLPTAYSLTEVEIYPERREMEDDEDALPEIRLAKITDVDEFGESLADCENVSIEEHYRRILNAQQALVEYQDEWIELEKCVKPYRFLATISIEEEQERDRGKARGATKEVAKPIQKVVNPRALPMRNDDPEKWFPTDDFMLLQDRLEAAVYGYIAKEGAKDVGHQDPVNQRPRQVGQNQRDLRARIPTQKIAQGEVDNESGEENRTLSLVNEALVVEGGRGKREKKPSIRVASESRGSTPVPTRGRPPRKHAKIRLQEIEADPTAGETMESTEQWVDNIGDVDSRPGTSSGIDTGPSSAWNTDDENGDRELSAKRKRQDTSDFEAAKKGNKARILDANVSANLSKADAEAIAKEKSSKRSEGAKMGWAKRKAEQQRRTSTRATSPDYNEINGSEQRDGAASSAKMEGDAQAKITPKKYIKKGKKEPTYITLPDGTIELAKSAATINMERRWAKKREAEALGLEPPKIGRYKKSELAAMKAVEDGEVADPGDGGAETEQKAAGKKRKILAIDDGTDDRAAEQSEAVHTAGKGSSKRRKKNAEQLEADAGHTAIDGDATGPKDAARNPFHGPKSNSGRKMKRMPADASIDTLAAHDQSDDEHEELRDANESTTPAYSSRRSTARSSTGKIKKGTESGFFGDVPRQSGTLGPFSTPPKNNNKRKRVNFHDEQANGFEMNSAPSGALAPEAPAISTPATRAPSTCTKRKFMAVLETRTILPNPGMQQAKGRVGCLKKTPALAIEPQITKSVVTEPLAKRRRTHTEKGLVTAEENPTNSISTSYREEPSQDTRVRPMIKNGRTTRARKGPAALNDQTSDPEAIAPPTKTKQWCPSQKSPVTAEENPTNSISTSYREEPSQDTRVRPMIKNGRTTRARKGPAALNDQTSDPEAIAPPTKKRQWCPSQKSPVTHVEPQAMLESNVSNPSKADQMAIPEIPRASIRGRRQASGVVSSLDIDSMTTPAPQAEEPIEKEFGSGSSGRPKRNRHPPNKYQVELEEILSTTRHVGIKSIIAHEPTASDAASQNASFPTYEAPEDSLPSTTTKKHKGSSRPKVELESPTASIEDIEVHAEFRKSVDPEATAATKAKEAARAAKSEKMKAITKARWASGEMEAVMARKKANNAAKKAAEATNPGSSSKKEKKITLKTKSPKPPKRRQTLGSAEKSDKRPHSVARPPFTTGRKISEYEQFQALTSPSAGGSPLPPRGRRPAALRASESFNRYGNDVSDSAHGEADGREAMLEDEVEKQINRQFASEYDHYQALASPESTIVLGKRARKPVMNLREAMAIEAAGEDDSFDD